MTSRSNKTKGIQSRNITFTDHRPKFLANVDAALRGSKSTSDEDTNRRRRFADDGIMARTEVLDPNRPAIPVRPCFDDDDDDDKPQIVEEEENNGMGRLSDEDEERDEDSPQVVVLKEGKHLSKEEVEAERIRLREQPDQPSSVPSSSRATIKASLSFSSSSNPSTSSGKRKIDSAGVANESSDLGWSELVKKTKGDKKTLVSTIKEEREAAQKAELTKKQKKIELKAKNKKAKSLMSFS